MNLPKTAKYIFITGGVVSGLGKGICASSIANILKSAKYNVFILKLDPYLNIDPGTMSPLQHGEVYVTYDGAETDLDLGHYERFIDQKLDQSSNITAGRIYQTVINNERKGLYKGKTVQVVPNITDEIMNNICKYDEKYDFIVVEIGGTVGDIESLPFIEAMRTIKYNNPKDVVIIHVGLVPYMEITNEYKTKPIQHSVKQLLSYGIQPDFIIARSVHSLHQKSLVKISQFCNIHIDNVISVPNVDLIYYVPLLLYKANIYQELKKYFNLLHDDADMRNWNKFIAKINNATKEINIAIVGKYTALSDAYLSVNESLKIAGWENNLKVKINLIDSQILTNDNCKQILSKNLGIIVPGGFGNRGIAGKISAIKYARENNIPFLGLCLGMQLAVIEFITNVCNKKNVTSQEFSNINKDLDDNNIFHFVNDKTANHYLGGTLRLGEYTNTVKKDTLLSKLYKTEKISERHRHRYEFNTKYSDLIQKNGMIISAVYEPMNLVEVIEIPSHYFFIASQFHPEFSSRPNKPNPLFNGFIKAIVKKNSLF